MILITLSVDILVRSLRSLRVSGKSKVSVLKILRERHYRISASRPCNCFCVRLKNLPYDCEVLSFKMLITR